MKSLQYFFQTTWPYNDWISAELYLNGSRTQWDSLFGESWEQSYLYDKISPKYLNLKTIYKYSPGLPGPVHMLLRYYFLQCYWLFMILGYQRVYKKSSQLMAVFWQGSLLHQDHLCFWQVLTNLVTSVSVEIESSLQVCKMESLRFPRKVLSLDSWSLSYSADCLCSLMLLPEVSRGHSRDVFIHIRESMTRCHECSSDIGNEIVHLRQSKERLSGQSKEGLPSCQGHSGVEDSGNDSREWTRFPTVP